VTLEQPEFQATSRQQVTLKPTGHETSPVQEVVPGRFATGPRPTLDDLDRLRQSGFERVLCLNAAGTMPEADRRVMESRSFLLVSGGSKPDAQLTAGGPVYVYSDDPGVLRAWWYRYFRDVEHLSDDAARVRSDRLIR
jgi:hypothetical protein